MDLELLITHLCASLFEQPPHDEEALPEDLRDHPDLIAALLTWVQVYMPPEADPPRTSSWVTASDDARETRRKLLEVLARLPHEATIPTLEQLAEEPAMRRSRPYIVWSAEEARRRTALQRAEAMTFAALRTQHAETPTSHEAMLRIVMRQLEWIEDDLRFGEFAEHRLFNKDTLEDKLQIWLANKLQNIWRGTKLQIARESEQVPERYPDLIANFNKDYEMMIEMKRWTSKSWSGAELLSALEDQLLATYLRDRDHNIGLLLLCQLESSKKKLTLDGQTRELTFAEFVAALDQHAQHISAQLPEHLAAKLGGRGQRRVHLRVMGMDFTAPPLPEIHGRHAKR